MAVSYPPATLRNRRLASRNQRGPAGRSLARADLVRQQSVGGEVHLRGLIEISNHCIRLCGYCGLRVDNRELPRYRMTADEIMACVREGVAFGYGTVVLQAGEDPGIGADWMADVVRRIKAEIAAGGDLEPGRAGARRTGPLARGRRGPLSAPLRDFQSPVVRADPSAPPRPSLRSHRPAGRVARVGLRSGQRRDDRHSGPELRRPGRRPGTVPRVESRHDRRRPVPHAPRDAAGRSPAAAGRAAGRAGAGLGVDDLQGDRPGPLALPAGEYSQHDGVGHAEPGATAASWAWSAGRTS